MKHAFVIAGTHSGVGKTTATLTLLAALHDKALIVQPFKVGPDYLDPGYHNLFSGGRKSRNLDSFLLGEDYIRNTFARNTLRTDVAVVEGVMGMFDGRDCDSEIGSTAHIAKMLCLPVILIVDAHAMARSAGAFVLGFKEMDTKVGLKGVIFNRVSGPKHYEYLKNAVLPEWGVEVLGFIPEDKEIEIPERHLGLTSALENPLPHSFFDNLKKASDCIEMDRLLKLTEVDSSLSCEKESGTLAAIRPHALDFEKDETKRKVRIGIAYDEAFSFYYEDNFDLLRSAGAELVFFSPLYGHAVPQEVDALYFGGGFPEMFAPQLSRNLSMMESIQKFAAEKRFIYAECGGLIYLAERFKDQKGQIYHLVGLVPGEVVMTSKLQSFGYKVIETCVDTFLFPKGQVLKSHEFHYSRWIASTNGFEGPYQIQDRKDGFWSYPILASYQHLHFGTHPSLAKKFVDSMVEMKYGLKAV